MGTYSKLAILFASSGNERAIVIDQTKYNFANNEDFSGGGWFRVLRYAQDQTLMAKRNTAGNQEGWELRLKSSGRLELILMGTDGTFVRVETTATFNDGRYHLFGFTWRGLSGNAAANAKLYVDGVAEALEPALSDTLAATIANAIDFHVGAVSSTLRGLAGQVDFVFLYDDVLAVGEWPLFWNPTADTGAEGDPMDPRIVHPDNCVAFWPMGDLTLYPNIRNLVDNGGMFAAVPDVDMSRRNHPMLNTNVGPGDLSADSPGGICSSSFEGNNSSERYSVTPVSIDPVIKGFEVGVPFSGEFWYKCNTASGHVIFSRVGASDSQGWYFGRNSAGGGGALFFILVDNVTGGGGRAHLETPGDMNDNTWHHIVGKYDGSDPVTAASMTLLVDDVDVGVVGTDTFPTGGTIKNEIVLQVAGFDGGNSPMDPSSFVCEVVLWARELSQGEVTDRYNGGVPTYPDVLGDDDIRFYLRPGVARDDLVMTSMQTTDIVAGPAGGIDAHASVLAGSGGGVAGPTLYFKMRAQADPGPGYETWVVQDTPDFTGTNAPGPVLGGTVIVAEEWAS